MRYKIPKAYRILNQLQGQLDLSEKQGHKLGSDSLFPTEEWEPCLRKQITNHPKLAINLSLMAGVLMGCWVKR